MRTAESHRGALRLGLVALVLLIAAVPVAIVSAAPAPAGPVTDYLAYVGGKKAQARGSVIYIGWVNAQGGQRQFLEATRGALAAVAYANAELNGARGHRLKLHTCYIAAAEEEGQKCGLVMANDANAPVVAFGAVVTGNQSFYATLKAKKPVIIGVSASPVDGVQKNVYALAGDQPHVLGPWGTFGRNVLHARTAALVFPNQPGANTAADATKKGLEDAGIKVTSVGYDPNATDLVGPITAAGAQNADMVVPMTDFPGCINFAKAAAQIGLTKPVVANPLCTFIPGAAYPGADFPKWYVGFAQSNTSIATLPDVAAYLKYAKKYGVTDADAPKAFSALSWSEILAVVRLMNAAGAGGKPITSASIAAQAKVFHGPMVMGPPDIHCGQFKAAPAICNNETQFYSYTGHGVWKRASGWLKPPK